MKVLYIIDAPSVFTPGTEWRLHVEEYAALVEEFHVLSRSPKGTEELQQGILFLHPLPPSKQLHIGMATARAHSLIQDHLITVVSAQDSFECGQVASQATQNTTAKLHVQAPVDIFSPWFSRGGIFSSFLQRGRLAKATTILSEAKGIRAFSKQIQESIVSHAQLSVPISVIPEGMFRELPPKKLLPERPFSFTFINASPLETQENLEDALEALALVGQFYPQSGLVLIGSGSKKSHLQKKAASLGLGNRVLFFESEDDAASLIQDAHAYIQTCAYETHPHTLLQAALSHIPIITTPVGCVGELFVPSVDVLTAPVGNIEHIAERMKVLIEDQRLRHVLSMGAHAKVEQLILSETEHAQKVIADLEKTARAS